MFKPTTFGKFFLYEKLAIGGMAEIFKAKLYGIAGFEKTLVVKQILPEYAVDNEFVKMFIDEANIAVSLTHGNIVPVYELGKIGDRYYIAMEYVDGENLETIIDQCRKFRRDIPVHTCVEVAIEVCKGLDYAHKKLGPDGKSLGIVHRDVSPQNVMVSFDGEVKLVDFGIAKAASKLSLTRVGTLKGKFGYMSPEQATGSDVDWRTDIYAVGIVLYETLTGTKLFDAENDIDLLKRVRAGAVIPPRLISPRVPESLDKLVLKALARDVGDPYAHAIQFSTDLQRWLYSRQPEPSEESLSDFMRALFRRDNQVAQPAAAPPSSSFIPPPELMEPRARRDISYAQNDEIVRALEAATAEARKVMVDGGLRAEPSFNADLSTSEQNIFDPQFGPVAVQHDDDRPTTSDGSDLNSVLVEQTNAWNIPTNGADPTRTKTGDDLANGNDADSGDEADTTNEVQSDSPDETIEYDETTDDNVLRAAFDQRPPPHQFVEERTTVEGPVVRVPARSGRDVKPPWIVSANPVPALPFPDADTARPKTDGSRVAGGLSRPAVKAPAPSKPGNGSAIISPLPPPVIEVPTSSPSNIEEPLFPPIKQGRVRTTVIAFVLLVLGLTGVLFVARESITGWVAVLQGPATPTPLPPTPAPTPFPLDSVKPSATGSAVAATPTATPTAIAMAPSIRKAAFDTIPSGASVFQGKKLLGTTPLDGVELPVDKEVSVRYALKGHRDLKRSYPAGEKALDVSETLEAIPLATPKPTPTPRATRTPAIAAQFGTVSINATPWGEVKIDGVKVKNTPVVKHKLKAGSHVVVITNPDFKKVETRTIVVHANVDEDPIVVSFE